MDDIQCILCYGQSGEIQYEFQPCGRRAACRQCANRLAFQSGLPERTSRRCPLCGTRFRIDFPILTISDNESDSESELD